MERKQVKSSNVASIGYDNGIMEVEFSNGNLYRYAGVTEADYKALSEADSIGKAFHSIVRGKYQGSKVEK
jgi:hypothetical protein